MEQYISKSALVAEIKKLHGNPYYMMAVKDVLAIIDSLQEEPVSEDLDEAAINYSKASTDGNVVDDWIVEDFKAGAEWSRNQAMAEIQAQSMALAHGYPKEETVSEELEEAAIEICSKVLEGETILIDGYEYVVLSDAEECFKAGAKWQLNKIRNKYRKK